MSYGKSSAVSLSALRSSFGSKAAASGFVQEEQNEELAEEDKDARSLVNEIWS